MADDARRFMRLLFVTVASFVVVPGGLTLVIPRLLVSTAVVVSADGLEVASVIGPTLVVAGFAVLGWAMWEFLVSGDGTPNPGEPPRFLVARGPYRLVRNPMYVAMGLVVAGEAVAWRSPLVAVYLVLLMTAFHLFVWRYEEPTLRRSFGAAYEAYCKDVPRWIPRWRAIGRAVRRRGVA